MKLHLVACILLLVTPIAAAAHHREVIVNGIRAAADAKAECECRARGKAFGQGEEICLGGSMAVCAMDQNVTTWQRTGRSCPSARLAH
jgi:hypothetical protein